jgi:hydrogenase/urease accessory protein HupE
VKRDRLSLLGLGVEHILTGYDHLVFLLGLVLVGGRWRSLLWVVTAFTVAHSITLGLAALGVWAPRPAIIEPAIALSIAYVGVENFFVKNAEKRWRITFPFGLVHGFGFAGALREVALPKADVPAALFLFNAGVEIGQLAVLALVLPALVLLRRWSWFDKHGVRVVSGAIVIAGLVWFVARVVSAQ